jgi:hypothetical protein
VRVWDGISPNARRSSAANCPECQKPKLAAMSATDDYLERAGAALDRAEAAVPQGDASRPAVQAAQIR